MSFESAELNLDSTGYFIIKGINNNIEDSASSNGSGKSTIFEALCWGLTGETVRGTKEVSNIYTNKGAYVEVCFTVDKDEYTIIRQKDPSSLLFYVNGEDKSGKGIRDTEKLLNQYLPDLSSSLIGSVIVLGQGLPQRFTNNSPSGRKEILEKLSKSDFMIVDLKDRVSKRKSDLSIQLRKIEDEILSLKVNKSGMEENINLLKEKIDKLDSVEVLQQNLDSYKNELDSYLKSKEDHEELLNIFRNSLSLFKESRDELNEKKSKICDSVTKKYAEELSDIMAQSNSIQGEKRAIKSEIDRIKNIKDVCPTCGQKLIGVEKPSTKELENKYESLTNLYKNLDSLYNEKNNQFNEELKNSCSDIDIEINIIISNINSKELEICDLIKCVDEDNNSISLVKEKILITEQKLKNRDDLYESYVSEYKECENKIEKLNEEILYNNNEHDLLSKRIEVVNRMFSALNKEFRGYLLTNVIQYIDKVSKEYCNQVFKNKNIEFKLDGNNISISYCGKEYENLSGGEKQKIDIIIQFAIRNMLSKYLNFSSNILVLDEITDFLDQQGVSAIVTLITENLKDTSAIYFITHHENLMFPYDNEIVVVKNNNISSLIYK